MSRLLLLVPTATYRAGAFVRAARRLPFDITIASEEPSSLSDLLPDDLIGMAFDDPEACSRQALAISEKHDIAAVIAVDDQVTVAAATINEALRLPGNSPDAVRATRDKLKMRERLALARVRQPKFASLSESTNPNAVARIGFPCVVKPLSLSASRGVTRADNADEMMAAVDVVRTIQKTERIENPENVLIEQYVPGWEVAVEGIVTRGELRILAIFDKPDPLEGPQFAESIYVTPSRLPSSSQDALRQLTQEAITAIGIEHGPIHAEIRGRDDDLWFIEVAARSIGGYCSRVLQFAGNRSLEEVIIRHALDPDEPAPELEAQAAGVLMMQAPATGRFIAMQGADAVRQYDHVEEVIVSAHHGQQLTPLPEGFLYVGFVFARGDSPEAVEQTLRSARDTLVPIIEPA